MLYIQQILAVVVLIAVFAISCFSAVEKSKNLKTGNVDPWKASLNLIGTFFGIYVALFIFFGFWWCLAQIGIWLRQAAQWVIEIVLLPLNMLLGLLF